MDEKRLAEESRLFQMKWKILENELKKVAKENVSGTTSLSNNAIQNAKDLSDVNKHNLRDYDNQTELIRTIYGTSDIVNDVKQVYLDEFEQARLEYNKKQTREDRKIEDYFKKVCESQNDIACEIIIELGDMDFWNDKDEKYRFKMPNTLLMARKITYISVFRTGSHVFIHFHHLKVGQLVCLIQQIGYVVTPFHRLQQKQDGSYQDGFFTPVPRQEEYKADNGK